jgi:starch phosphorylase
MGNGWQREQPDNWLRRPDPWEVARPDDQVEIPLNSSFEVREGALRPVAGRPSTLIGMPFDRPVVGYGGKTINTLRLWADVAPDSFDFQAFSHGQFVSAMAETLAAESLTRVLYPDDSTISGQGLRFVQEYFLVACSLADLVRRFRRTSHDWKQLPDKAAIQLNDTHPAMAVSELMRILLDEEHLEWDEAWDVTRGTLAYTNHTLLPEALEKWPVAWFEMLLPRHLEIIFEINRRLLDEVRARFPGVAGRAERVSLIEEGPTRHVRMANLAIVGSHSTNGVAAIHSALLRTVTVRDLAETFPERFGNKTNGVTPRRWLLLANPPLARLITEAIGDRWITDVGDLARLKPLADDRGFRDAFVAAKAGGQVDLRGMAPIDLGADGGSAHDLRQPGQAHPRIQTAAPQCAADRRALQPIAREPCARDAATDVPLRRQGGTGLPSGQADHQAREQPRRHPRRRSIGSRATQGRLPAGVQRVAGRAADSRDRGLQSDLDRRLRGERHQQHEIHDERCADHRHP